jgi:hypothetical protein
MHRASMEDTVTPCFTLQMWAYVWVERWSEEAQAPYFFNQETKTSVWERPADLGWRRVCMNAATQDGVTTQ